MKTIEEDIKLINSVFGSENSALHFLETEGRDLCSKICGKNVVIPRFEIRPSIMATGAVFNTGLRSAEYEPAEGKRSAVIILFPSALQDKKLTIIAIAHELIHHWENTGNSKNYRGKYPEDAEKVINASFSSQVKIKKWKSAHSEKFITKAYEVSKILNVTFQQMLVHR